MVRCEHPDDRLYRCNNGWMCDRCDTWYETDPRLPSLEERVARLERALDLDVGREVSDG